MNPSNAAQRSGGSPRILRLEGGCNFRDIGGYATADGQIVAWGRVYRAGVLSYVTERDRTSLKSLGIRAVCDLRRADERKKEPTQWLDEQTQALYWEDSISMPTLRSYAARRPNTAQGMFAAMIDLYRSLPLRMASRIQGLANCIANDHVPLIVHCAAGKDRTGVAIAVLLSILGVPREAVIEDYLLTNEAGNFEDFIRTRHASDLGLADEKHPLLAMPEALRRVLLSVDAAFIDAAFHQIEKEPGGMHGYIEHTLGLNAKTREKLRAALLIDG